MPELSALLASVDAARDEIVALLQDLVRLPTVNAGARPDTGDESLAAPLLSARLDEAGIPYETLFVTPGRANILARLGAGGGKRLLLMSHTDVVPVEDESLWEHPPFSGTLDRGRIYGRGADDDKGDVVAHLMAMVLLQRAGVALNGDLLYLAAADEESGGQWGVGGLAAQYPEKLRVDYAVNEGGGSPIRTPRGLLYPLCTGEKSRLEAKVTRKGRSGHASRPWAADNPVPVLAEAIQRIQAYEPEIDVSHPFFRQVLTALGVSQTPTAENIDRIADGLDAQPALSSTLKAASRMTITPTMLSAGVKSNSIPDRASLVCDVRGLPGQDDTFVRQELAHVLSGLDVDIDVLYTAVSNASPADSAFVGLIEQALAAALGSDTPFRLVPALTVGFTDSRFVRPLGAQVYGFSPHHPNAEPLRSGVHGNNEFMEVDSLLLRTKFALALSVLCLA